jgi:hypothetical protein
MFFKFDFSFARNVKSVLSFFFFFLFFDSIGMETTSSLSSHALDTTLGKPAAGMPVTLFANTQGIACSLSLLQRVHHHLLCI